MAASVMDFKLCRDMPTIVQPADPLVAASTSDRARTSTAR